MLSPLWKVLTLLTAATASPATDSAVEAETAAWHAQRKERLTAEDGWLTLTGLVWLPEGKSSAGSDAQMKVKLPASAPAFVGTFDRTGGEVTFTPAPGVTPLLRGQPFPGGRVVTDEKGPPDVLRLGPVQWMVIRRGQRFGVRIKDAEAPARKQFKDIPRFPGLARWRVEATLVAQPVQLEVPNVVGTRDVMESPGVLVFTLDGKEHRLRPVLEKGEDSLFVIFGDPTNRDTTYGAGRFLYAAKPVAGKTVLDFNRAYNPPCAFSAYATCPVPPAENKLKVRIEAGEKRYGSH